LPSDARHLIDCLHHFVEQIALLFILYSFFSVVGNAVWLFFLVQSSDFHSVLLS